MPITKLEPLRLKDEFYLNIEKALADYFYRLIYAPMYNEVADEIGKDWAQIYNAKSQELAEPLQKHLLKMLVTGNTWTAAFMGSLTAGLLGLLRA